MSDKIQYTIRGVSKAADARLRQKARQKGLSLNAYFLQIIGSDQGRPKSSGKVRDLSWMLKNPMDDETYNAIQEQQAQDKADGQKFLYGN